MTQPDLPMDFPPVFDLDVERADCPWPQPEPRAWAPVQHEPAADFWILCVALPVVLALLLWSLT